MVAVLLCILLLCTAMDDQLVLVFFFFGSVSLATLPMSITSLWVTTNQHKSAYQLYRGISYYIPRLVLFWFLKLPTQWSSFLSSPLKQRFAFYKNLVKLSGRFGPHVAHITGGTPVIWVTWSITGEDIRHNNLIHHNRLLIISVLKMEPSPSFFHQTVKNLAPLIQTILFLNVIVGPWVYYIRWI